MVLKAKVRRTKGTKASADADSLWKVIKTDVSKITPVSLAQVTGKGSVIS